MNKCIGCGAILQDNNKEYEGYTKNLNNSLCERCFRIKNYSDYKLISKDNNEFINILENIGKTNNLVILVVDLFNIPKFLNELNKYINNDILLVLTKRDLIPLSVYDLNLIKYFNQYKLNIVDSIIISSNKNYNFDNLLSKIKYYQTSKEVYVVGYTNAGKSTMINKLIYNYTDKKPTITTSMLPSTTINSIEIEIDDKLSLIDTPGLLEENNIIDVVDIKTMKRIVPNKEIKPITYQIKAKQSLIVDDLLRLDLSNVNSLTFYISNNLNIERYFKDIDKLKNLVKHEIKIPANSDLVVSGLGFIKFINEDELTLYTLNNVDVYVRPALI